MSRLRKPILVMAGLVLLVPSVSVFAQQGGDYTGWPPQVQSRNIPAGSVVDPGSSLLYILDTGINVRKDAGPANADLTALAFANPLSQHPTFGLGGSQSIYDANGNVNPSAILTNFVAITNTHPTQAVTVHFRYFNDECVDILDFLVLLTCNDTLVFDPFNFSIPKSPFNTRNRIFGPDLAPITAISQRLFGSGRFLLFGAASGTSVAVDGVADDRADILFPFEFRSDFFSGQTQIAGDDCENLAFGNFGSSPSLSANNLHVFNASAVAFNYLVGYQTTAVPGGFINDPDPANPNPFLAYGVNAWARPAVDLSLDAEDTSAVSGNPDGDGPPLLNDDTFRILMGSEPVLASNGVTPISPVNLLYLRNDVHGGDTRSSGVNSHSFYGALAWQSLLGANPINQLVHFLSAVDDYDGSRHATDTPVFGFRDRSYNMNGARTVYVLQIYDNDENLFEFPEDTPINISPVPPGQQFAELKITVDCLRVWLTTAVTAQTSIDDFQVLDLNGLDPSVLAHVTKAVVPTVDASQGWIRFVRDNSENGTRVSPLATAGANNAGHASFVTIGVAVIKFQGFGASYWLSSSAYDTFVSETGLVAP